MDVVCYIRQTIVEVFGNNGNDSFYFFSSDDDPFLHKTHGLKISKQTIGLKANEGKQGRERLGEAGLSLHYANLIQQIDSIVSFFHILLILISKKGSIYILWLNLKLIFLKILGVPTFITSF